MRRLLYSLKDQSRDTGYIWESVIVDNDASRSGEPVVQEVSDVLRLPLKYFCEPIRNISLARNLAIEKSKGDLIAFIDDDEFPSERWLDRLVECYDQYGVDGVLGPVRPHFETHPPRWIIKGRLCERPTHPTGTPITQKDMRTGNVLLSRALFVNNARPFDPKYGVIGGGDVDFFDRMTKQNKAFIWCNEAAVFESVPEERLKRSYYINRALSRGASNALKVPFFSKPTLRSIIAIGLYPLSLPFALIAGHGVFMRIFVSYCDHLGRILGLLGLNPVKNRPYRSLGKQNNSMDNPGPSASKADSP